MNFLFISLQFPRTYWNFSDRLKKTGMELLVDTQENQSASGEKTLSDRRPP